MKQPVQKTRAAALLLALCLLLTSTVFAFAGGGNGDGTGGGKGQPLVLASSSIANGAENVSKNPKIVLTFSKNVVHFTVRDNNKTCFSMTDENGNDVPINVEMGDDQVDPTIKRIVTIVPQSSLTPGTTYLLKIGGGVTSKSGVSIGKDSYISFTVEGEKPTATTKPTTTKPAATKPAATKPAATKPAATKPTTTKPAATKPAATQPAAAEPAAAQPVSQEQTVSITTAPAAEAEDAATVLTEEADVLAQRLTDEEDPADAASDLFALLEEAPETESADAETLQTQAADAVTQQTQTTAKPSAAKKQTSPDRQQAWRDTGLYLLIIGISIIVLLAVVWIINIKKKKH